MQSYYDVVIVGSGVSGSKIAQSLMEVQGLKVCMLEAGNFYTEKTFPIYEAEANTQMYWGGGMELTSDGGIALLRARVVGGGSIVNQALVDRFDEAALVPWEQKTGLSFLSVNEMAPYYEQAEASVSMQTIKPEDRNRNAQIFSTGCEKNKIKTSSLRRAQSNCDYKDGADCIDCLFGCRRKSKQSTVFNSLKLAMDAGMELKDQCEVDSIDLKSEWVKVNYFQGPNKDQHQIKARRLVMAAGCIGNVKLVKKSFEDSKISNLGQNFFVHPQYMVVGVYGEQVDAFQGAFQSMKSDDPNFRKQGFKLENVFGPPVAMSMLFKGMGKQHHQAMRELSQMACIEVAVRDTNPGQINVNKAGRVSVIKKLNTEDRKRRSLGLEVISDIFSSTGAKKIMQGDLPIGLHLMGGCSIGSSQQESVVNPQFQLWNDPRVYVADSSIFPTAPGINPSLTIMALSFRASSEIKKDLAI